MVALRNNADRYGAVAQGLHWLIALLVVVQFGLAWYAGSLPRGPLMIELFGWHKSLGVLVLALAILRVAWRIFDRPPPLPASMQRWEQVGAHASHGMLYLLLFVQPLSGMVMSWTTKRPLVVFGATLPNPLGPNEALHDAANFAHEWISYALLAVVALHVSAALRHHWWRRDEVLVRMVPGLRARRAPAASDARAGR